MAATVNTVNTLDITFHINDGTAVGDSYTWKFNNPSGAINSLSAVRDAFGGASGFLSDYFTTSTGSVAADDSMFICNASGDVFDNIDAARKVETVTTKEDLG